MHWILRKIDYFRQHPVANPYPEDPGKQAYERGYQTGLSVLYSAAEATLNDKRELDAEDFMSEQDNKSGE